MSNANFESTNSLMLKFNKTYVRILSKPVSHHRQHAKQIQRFVADYVFNRESITVLRMTKFIRYLRKHNIVRLR